jgi:putative hydrolase of the HAD superfamily
MIKNILFDFGGVIINIDPYSVIYELAKLGVDNGMELHLHLKEQKAYSRLEKSEISPAEFRDMVRGFTGKALSDEEIDHAWNSIIKDIPQHRIDLLERLKMNYRIFLLSNSNSIHYEYYNQYVRKNFNYESLDSIFDRAWYSFRMGLYKPDPKIFKAVLKEGGLIAGETLFIDDNEKNVVAAKKVGLKGYHLKEGEDVVEIFEDGLLDSSIF